MFGYTPVIAHVFFFLDSFYLMACVNQEHWQIHACILISHKTHGTPQALALSPSEGVGKGKCETLRWGALRLVCVMWKVYVPVASNEWVAYSLSLFLIQSEDIKGSASFPLEPGQTILNYISPIQSLFWKLLFKHMPGNSRHWPVESHIKSTTAEGSCWPFLNTVIFFILYKNSYLS